MTRPDVDPLAWIPEQLQQLNERQLRRSLQARAGKQSVVIKSAGQQLINFGSNDYLGLASDPRLADAVCEAVAQHGWGSGASPLVTGYSELHEQLETELARFEHADSALLFTTGYAANVGAISSLVGREDAVFSDEQNHASILDGCRLSRAKVFVYRHCDVEHLSSLLAESGVFRRRLIVSDTVFSMQGDAAPLIKIAAVAERHDAMLLVDEAHATGVFGETGSGLVQASGVDDQRVIRVGTLSKALGSIGGFVVGPTKLKDLLLNVARSYIFSTAMPAAMCAAGLKALEIVRDEPWRRERLLERASDLRRRLQAQGWDTGLSTSQIIPVVIGDAGRTMQIAATLREQGFLVPGIRPPSVPAGRSLLRISVTAAHTDEMLDKLSEAFADLSRK